MHELLYLQGTPGVEERYYEAGGDDTARQLVEGVVAWAGAQTVGRIYDITEDPQQNGQGDGKTDDREFDGRDQESSGEN